MNMAIDANHNVIPSPEPETACGSADSGGYIVQPAIAGPDSTKSENNMMQDDTKKNQNDNILRKPEAMSLAPNCKGIRRFEKVPDNPPVRRKKTIIVPWIVTKPKYISSRKTPPGAHVSPRKKDKKSELSPGQAN